MIRQKGYKIPVIGLTGNVMDEDTQYFIKNGVTTVLHKPLTIANMHQCLDVYARPKKPRLSKQFHQPTGSPLAILSEVDSGRIIQHQEIDGQEEYRV